MIKVVWLDGRAIMIEGNHIEKQGEWYLIQRKYHDGYEYSELTVGVVRIEDVKSIMRI